MTNKFVFICFYLVAAAATAQQYKSTSGRISFFAEAALGDIDAASSMASATLRRNTGEVTVVVPVTSFVFKKKLMQQHFNESYLESDRYPDATFTGTIAEMNTPGEISGTVFDLSGTLTLHGVSKPRQIKATLVRSPDGTLVSKGSFSVELGDHKVKIPKLLFQNVVETVDVKFEFVLKQLTHE
jgi:polyisoprenoid-binding protein YceI